MITNLELVWSDGYRATVEMLDNPVSRHMVGCVKHLQHLQLDFNHRDNPLARCDQQQLRRQLEAVGQRLSVPVDPTKLGEQPYLNELHDHYLKSYAQDPRSDWMLFHDALHSMEDRRHNNRTHIYVDYKDRAGPLVQSLDRSWLQYATTGATAGDCSVGPHELGKSFWHYYRDRDRGTTKHICEAVTPWLYLRPVLDICYQTPAQQITHYESDPEFRAWVDGVAPAWRQHWGITDWSPTEMESRIQIGRVQDIDTVAQRFAGGHTPDRLRLQS